jgi:hypothetical protein
MINWRQKLSSRKFWALIAGVATSSLVLFGTDEETITKIVALIGASVVGYMFAEAYIDGKAVEKT